MPQTPEGQRTLDSVQDVIQALDKLDAIIAAAEAGGAAWDTATAAQRTAAIRILAKAVRGLAWTLQGHVLPGSARMPD